MELRQLQHFLALAELGSFRLAGERVHLTQQAVSKSIAQFEARIGAPLFERDGRQRAPDAGGRAAAAPCAGRHGRAEALRRRSTTRSAAPAPDDSPIGSTPTLLGDVIPDVLKGLHRARPRLVLAVISGDWDTLRERLQRGEIDVVISTEPVGVVDEDVVIEPLCDECHVVLAARDHPLAGPPPTPRQLHRASWVGIDRLPRAEADLRRYFEAGAPEATDSAGADRGHGVRGGLGGADRLPVRAAEPCRDERRARRRGHDPGCPLVRSAVEPGGGVSPPGDPYARDGRVPRGAARGAACNRLASGPEVPAATGGHNRRVGHGTADLLARGVRQGYQWAWSRRPGLR